MAAGEALACGPLPLPAPGPVITTYPGQWAREIPCVGRAAARVLAQPPEGPTGTVRWASWLTFQARFPALGLPQARTGWGRGSQASGWTNQSASQARPLGHQLPVGPLEAQRGLQGLPSASTATVAARPHWHRSLHQASPPEVPSTPSARGVLQSCGSAHITPQLSRTPSALRIIPQVLLCVIWPPLLPAPPHPPFQPCWLPLCLSSCCLRAFALAVPSVWNTLPLGAHRAPSLPSLGVTCMGSLL